MNFIQRYFAIQRTRKELNRLDDRELLDLGINRYDIDRIARQSIH